MQMSKESTTTSLISQNNKNLNLIHINLDFSENSTRSSNVEKGKSKSINEDEEINIKTHKSKVKKITSNFLNKKKKSNQSIKKSSKTNNDGKMKSGKYKLIYKLFNEFKSSSPLYKEYPQFCYIEKNVKNNLYSSLGELANEIRNVFSQIFFSSLNSEKYNQTLILCEAFEKIYKNYDNKVFSKESKILLEIINKLKKELRQTELLKNSYNNSNNNSYYFNKNKYKIQLNDSDSEIIPNMSVKKFKNELTNKIKKLNNEQKKGILSIISSNNLDEDSCPSTLKIDVNKMSFNQLTQLKKYVNKCIKENNNNNNNKDLESENNPISRGSYKLEENIGSLKSRSIEEEKEGDIIKNDDLSSGLSDDEDDDEDE